MSTTFLILACGALVTAIVLFTLYWISDESKANQRDRIVYIGSYLIIFTGIVVGGGSVLASRAGTEIHKAQVPIHTLIFVLLGYMYLHHALVIEPRRKHEDAYYAPISGPAFIFFIIIIIGKLFFDIFLDLHFLWACLVTCGAAIVLKRRNPQYIVFKTVAVLLVLMFLGLILLDPFVYVRGHDDFIRLLLMSAGLNAMYASVPFLFIVWGMLHWKVLSQAETGKVFRWTAVFVIGSLVYRDPVAREYISMVPLMKDIVPAATGAGAYFLPVAVLLTKHDINSKNTQQAS